MSTSLQNCTECGYSVSTSALKCPRCGTREPFGLTCAVCGRISPSRAVVRFAEVQSEPRYGGRQVPVAHHESCLRRVLSIPPNVACPDCRSPLSGLFSYGTLAVP